MGTASANIRFKLTIPSGQTESKVAIGRFTYGSSSGIGIQSPTTLPEAVNIYVTSDPTGKTGFQPWVAGSPAVAIGVPPAGQSSNYVELVIWGAFKLVTGAGVGAARDFYVTSQGTF